MKSDSSTTQSPSSFVVVNKNGSTVLIAGETAVNYINLAIPYQVHTLITYDEDNVHGTTSCAVSADGNRAITTHQPAQVRLWVTNQSTETRLDFGQPSISIENSSALDSFCWINRNGTCAVAIFMTHLGSLTYRFNWNAKLNFVSISEKSDIRVASLAISEEQKIAIILGSCRFGPLSQLYIQKLNHVGSSAFLQAIDLPNFHSPSRVCIAESAPIFCLAMRNEIRVFGACENNNNRFEVMKIFKTSDTLADVSADGTRLLTYNDDILFKVWHIPTGGNSILQRDGKSNAVMRPLFSSNAKIVFCADITCSIWKINIDSENQFSSNLRHIQSNNGAGFQAFNSSMGGINNAWKHQFPIRFAIRFMNLEKNVESLTRFELPQRAHGICARQSNNQHQNTTNTGSELKDQDVKDMELAIQSMRNVLIHHHSSPNSNHQSTDLFSSPTLHCNRDINQGLKVLEIERELEKLARVLDRIKNVSLKEEQTMERCAIDLEPFKVGEKVLCLPCDHMFHFDCTWDYLNSMTNPKCPLCRKEFNKMFGFLHLSWHWKGDGTDKENVWSNTMNLTT